MGGIKREIVIKSGRRTDREIEGLREREIQRDKGREIEMWSGESVPSTQIAREQKQIINYQGKKRRRVESNPIRL